FSTFTIAKIIGEKQKENKEYLKLHKKDLSRQEKKDIKAKNKAKLWKWLLLALFINFGILGIIKYADFVISNINALFQLDLGYFSFVVPLGISYYTFMSMGYIIDVYRGKYPPQGNILKFALFTSFFPQLIQGPIGRYDEMSKTLYGYHPFDNQKIYYGIQRIIWGYFKKLVIADRILIACNTIFSSPDEFTGIFVFVGLMFYSIDIYCDFTGGIDIAIGVAELFGVQLTENFNRPYFSKSLSEFWNRWHITMCTWFKDYIFYPISVCNPMLKLSKWSRKTFGDAIGKRIPVYLATLVVWFLTGVWHGAAWSFIAWGLGNAIVLLISQELHPFYHWFHERFDVANKFWYRLFQVGRTFLLVSFLRIFDCYGDVGLAFQMLGRMFTQMNIGQLLNGSLLQLGLTIQDYIIVIVGVLILLAVSLLQRKVKVRDYISKKKPVVQFALYYVLIFVIVIFGVYGIGYDATSFIYNQF
ncbi:MAG: hypothetical protein LUF02_00550, partial [Erysipelotrichaceae bacterium]|nr:hypothetical protein [Erysipelotrichaceae bacterium]